MRKQFMAIFAISGLLMMPFAINSAMATDHLDAATASTTVTPPCGINLPNTLIAFGPVPPGQSSTNKVFVVDNSGGVAITQVDVKGTQWNKIAGPGDVSFAVGSTTFDDTNVGPYTALTLVDQDSTIGGIPVAGSGNINFVLNVPNVNTINGNYEQTITVTATC